MYNVAHTVLREKVSTCGLSEDISELNVIRVTIEGRVIMLDNFYERNYFDDSIHLFHMLKIKYQRAILHSKSIDNDTFEFSIINPNTGRNPTTET